MASMYPKKKKKPAAKKEKGSFLGRLKRKAEMSKLKRLHKRGVRLANQKELLNQNFHLKVESEKEQRKSSQQKEELMLHMIKNLSQLNLSGPLLNQLVEVLNQVLSHGMAAVIVVKEQSLLKSRKLYAR